MMHMLRPLAFSQRMFLSYSIFCLLAVTAAQSSAEVFDPATALAKFGNGKTSFESFVKAPGKRLALKFSMPTCPPCIASRTAFAGVSAAFPDMVFVDVDITNTAHAAVTNNFGVRSVPFFALIDANGKTQWSHLGAGSDIMQTLITAIKAMPQ